MQRNGYRHSAAAVAAVIVATWFYSSARPEALGGAIAKATSSGENRSAPVVVLELFTSEGCSSCPPADKNLARVVAESRAEGKNVYALSFHVDYWNDLGWKDPFSRPSFTTRQRTYANQLKQQSVYTPELVVNGQIEFVGSDRKLTDKAIDLALTIPAKHAVRLALVPGGSPEMQQLSYHVDGVDAASGDLSDYVINVALVAENEERAVKGGENDGARLRHVNVVERLLTLPLEKSEGEVTLNLKRPIGKKMRVIAYIQSKETLVITGAAEVEV
jgi:hypothetical protein